LFEDPHAVVENLFIVLHVHCDMNEKIPWLQGWVVPNQMQGVTKWSWRDRGMDRCIVSPN